MLEALVICHRPAKKLSQCISSLDLRTTNMFVHLYNEIVPKYGEFLIPEPGITCKIYNIFATVNGIWLFYIYR